MGLFGGIKKAFTKKGRKVAEEHVTAGYIAAHEGRLDAALKHYEDAIDADDVLAVAYFDAGQTELARFNRDVAALDDAARAARLDRALTFLERGLALEPDHAPSWRTLARVRERQGRMADAGRAWQRTSELLGAVDVAGVKDVAAHHKERDEAKREAARLRAYVDVDAAFAAATAALSGDVDVDRVAAADALVAVWQRAADTVPEPRRLYALLGALLRKADPARARAMLQLAVERDRHDLDALKDLATLAMAAGDLPAALAASMAAYREDPVDAGLVCNVGVVHLALGNVDEAREFITLAASMAEDDPIVRRALASLPR
jgi:tetratricopeptide (TPR) repeat protein